MGEIDTQEEANENLLGFLPLTFFIILLILLLLFNNWKKVLLILVCFPFVFCGITPSLLGFGQPFTFMAIIGMMGLIGMGNNPMVGASVAVAVAVEEAMK